MSFRAIGRPPCMARDQFCLYGRRVRGPIDHTTAGNRMHAGTPVVAARAGSRPASVLGRCPPCLDTASLAYSRGQHRGSAAVVLHAHARALQIVAMAGAWHRDSVWAPLSVADGPVGSAAPADSRWGPAAEVATSVEQGPAGAASLVPFRWWPARDWPARLDHLAGCRPGRRAGRHRSGARHPAPRSPTGKRWHRAECASSEQRDLQAFGAGGEARRAGAAKRARKSPAPGRCD